MMAGKASKKFDLGELGKALAVPVSESDTMRREQIEYIDIDRIDSDPENFYSLSGIDALAADIETIGLQQPLRVRPGENGHVIIVSGHRRCAAMRMLVESGREDLREITCILERGDVSPALQELRLIYANAHTRALTSAEVSQQAERVEKLLYQLKEEGYEFPGRMRDHVAEACQVSKTKLARLSAIRNGLAACFRDAWERGDLPEETAYELSRLPEDTQRRIRSVMPRKLPFASGVAFIRKRAEDGQDYTSVRFSCPDGSVCSNLDKFLKHDMCASSWERCSGKCCIQCDRGGAKSPGSYGAACQEMCSAAKEAYAEAKEKAEKHIAEKEAQELNKAQAMAQHVAHRIAVAADLSGVDDKCMIRRDHPTRSIGWCRDASRGKFPKDEPAYWLRYILPNSLDGLVVAAKLLKCSIEYLAGLTDDPRPAASQQDGPMVLAAWMPGALTPPEPCDVMADLQLADLMQIRKLLHWDGSAFLFRRGGEKVEVDVIRWLRLPETEEEND